MTAPSPEHGIFRWAWRRAAQRRAKFWVAAVLFTAIASAISAFVALPAHLAADQKALAAVAVVLIAAIVVVASTYLWELLAAPYQQRNELRRVASTLLRGTDEAEIAATPASAEHAQRLRDIATRLRNCIESLQPLDYGKDSNTWRKAFGEHFPHIRSQLELAEEDPRAEEALCARLIREADAIGMAESPWTLGQFSKPVANLIAARSMQGILQSHFNFGWTRSEGAFYLGDPSNGIRIFFVPDLSLDFGALKSKFEKFMLAAEGWPQAADIRELFDLRARAAKAAIPMLEIAANTDPIMTICSLCQRR